MGHKPHRYALGGTNFAEEQKQKTAHLGAAWRFNAAKAVLSQSRLGRRELASASEE
jgi:hypothetical protein